MDNEDRTRITKAVDFWIKTKIEQKSASEAAGSAQGGTRAAVTGGKHMAGVNRLILDELGRIGLKDLTHLLDRSATVPGFYRPRKDWDLLVFSGERPVLALELKSMTGSEGKNLNNRADEMIGAGKDLQRAKQQGLVPLDLQCGYVFLMEVTPEVKRPVAIRTRVGKADSEFDGVGYLRRMALMCERVRDDGLYDMAWALGVVRDPVGFEEPLESVNWDRFKSDLRWAFR